eukprot:7259475-Prymnesium_polylepis.1
MMTPNLDKQSSHAAALSTEQAGRRQRLRRRRRGLWGCRRAASWYSSLRPAVGRSSALHRTGAARSAPAAGRRRTSARRRLSEMALTAREMTRSAGRMRCE